MQIKSRPIIGGMDKEFMQQWDQHRKTAEAQFLVLQQEYITRMASKTKNDADSLAKILEDKISDDTAALQESKDAIATVANRVRASEYTKLNARWGQDLASHEARKFGVRKQTKTKTQSKPAEDQEPQPGPSNKPDFTPRVYKKAKRSLTTKQQQNHNKYLSKVKAGKGQVDPNALAKALTDLIQGNKWC